MAIRALSLGELNRFNSTRATVARHTDHAVEWFADDTDTVLGAIAFHHDDLQWSLVVLWRDHHGSFHICDRAGGLAVLDEARRLVQGRMHLALSNVDQVLAAQTAA